jgi:hypothetical protein
LLLISAGLAAIVLAQAPAAAPVLITAIVQDKDVSACAKQSGKPVQLYVRGAFDLRYVRLRSGEQMSVATATDPCLSLGQSTRIMIFLATRQGYRRVLNEVTLPGLAQVGADGTVTLPTHESMEVIFEASYIWNGAKYIFAPLQSHRYDVALGERRPYEVSVRLVRGAAAVTLSGSVAYNFGDDYVFYAIAGETLTIELAKYSGMVPRVTLYYRDELSSVAETDTRGRWSGRLRKAGTYHLLVSGADEAAESRRSRYVIRLAIY